MYDGIDTREPLSADRLFATDGALVSDWARDRDGKLFTLDEGARRASLDRLGGVFLIGFGGRLKTAVLIGQSDDIGEDLSHIRVHPQVTAFSAYGGLAATWLTMPAALRPSVERHLVQTLTPVLATKCPMSEPLAVSVPVEFGGKAGRKPSMLL